MSCITNCNVEDFCKDSYVQWLKCNETQRIRCSPTFFLAQNERSPTSDFYSAIWKGTQPRTGQKLNVPFPTYKFAL